MSAQLSWFKSSYSDDQGSACLEVAYTWHKSSHSDSRGGACLEAAISPGTVHLRDSKLGARSPEFRVAARAWADFVTYARHT